MTKPRLEYVRRADGAGESFEPLSVTSRIFCGFFGIAVPILCFALALSSSPIAPLTKSIGRANYAGFLFGGPATYPFYPFLAFAVVAMSMVLIAPERYANSLPVRLGIYSGMLLAFQYCVIELIGGTDMAIWASIPIATLIVVPLEICLCMIPIGFFWIIAEALAQVVPRAGWYIIACIGAAAAVFLELRFGRSSLINIAWGFGLLLAAAPQATFIVFGFLAAFVWKHAEEPPSHRKRILSFVLPWLSTYLVAWCIAISKAITEYELLPKPGTGGCYVCTAAANGHPWLVGTEWIKAADGARLPVNNQIRRLKCAEIAMHTVWPGGHRLIRSAYDWFGPRIAQRLRHPLLCDIAFIAMVPLEWLAVAVMAAMGFKPFRLSELLYADRTDGSSITLATKTG